MDSSMLDAAIDDGSDSDGFVPTKPKLKAVSKTIAKAAPKKSTAPKKPTVPRTTTKKTVPAASNPKAKPAVAKKRSKPDTEDEDPSSESQTPHDDSVLSATPPMAKKQKQAPKKAAGRPLEPIENEVPAFDGASEERPKKGSATEQYQKLTQLEHIIKRPDTYIGSVERSEKSMWVYNSELEQMEYREVSFVPGLYKIFDEILVNAADNKQRDKNMDAIKVTVDRESGEISVWNNGRGIPIEIHEKEQIYIPEMIFGHLLTGSNYDDDEQKVTGGRNGYGAKLCNIFSTVFTLETADAKTKKLYKQKWTNNMSIMGKAATVANKGDDYTKVTFIPDYAKFKMTGMDDDLEALIKRRVYDIAGTNRGVKVYLNGKKVAITDFKKYMEMYRKAIIRERGEEAANDVSEIVSVADPNGRWEIGFAVSDGTFQQVSFVNSIATTSGGTHVNYIADQVCNKLMEIVKKKNKAGASMKPTQIRNHIFLFVNCLVINPAFTSQTKEQLTTKATQFGSKCTVADDFIKKIAKTEVITNILAFAALKADQILKKSDGSRKSRMDNPKLTDANKAGTKDGYQCTLILTEGDSAKGLAMSGRSIVGPDLFGIFPLRGKLLNVRDAPVDQISKNVEIQNIKNILGLKHKTEYTDCKSLRYGHIMIMTDQDHDGSHIKGLLINFLQVQYPSLLRIPEFLIEFITPIIKVWKGDPKQPSKSHTFFTMPEYAAWKSQNLRGWEHKYYKGLGTSNDEDAQVYFNDLDKHLKEFHTMQDSEPELIELVFSKKKADERKEWLRQFIPGTYLDHTTRKITYTDFVNREMILFSMADNLRSIPSVVDGLKPGQRKVLYACFKRNLKKDIKVVELAGYTSGITAYQHGETSLQQTIVGLAQTFVGSNNVNFLEPSGNFGTRLQGGGDSASPRYIYTRLSPFARRIIHPLDEKLLKYNTDDERTIEPEIYVPVVPMILINGADGIGSGWSSSIPNYSPEDIVENLKLMMDGQPPNPMVPWFRDFKGTVTQIGPDKYEFSGIIAQTGDTELEITELPIRVWTQDFKDKLVEAIKAEKMPSGIKDYDDYNTPRSVHFVIRMEEKFMDLALTEGLVKRFKLTRSIATSNMVAFDPEGRITKYNTVEDILKEFFAVRIKFYEKRKEWQLNEWNRELEKLTNQARFIQMIIDGTLVVYKKKKRDLVLELKEKKFKPFAKVKDASKDADDDALANIDNALDDEIEASASDYDYLVGMAIWSFTKERVEKLLQQIGEKEHEIDALIKLSREDLWKKDLDEFIGEWRLQLEEEQQRLRKVARMGRRASSKLKTHFKTAGRKHKGDDSFSDSDFGGGKKTKKAAAVVVKQVPPKSGLLSQLSPPPKLKQSKIKTAAPKAAPKAKGTTQGTQSSSAVDTASGDQDLKDIWMNLDGADSNSDVPAAISKAPAAVKPAAAAATKKTASKSKKILSDDSDEEIIAPPAKAPRETASRAPRAAARKPVKYNAFSDSDADDGDDGDEGFDVSKMVKGIGASSSAEAAAAAAAAPSRPLFSATTTTSLSRPGSSAGLAARRSTVNNNNNKPAFDLDDSNDETDYTRLAPVVSGSVKAAATSAASRAPDFSDDDDSEDLDGGWVRQGRVAAAAAGEAVAAVPVPKVVKGKGAAAGGGVKAVATKTAAAKKTVGGVAAALVKEGKKVPLSPAAKAYAAKYGREGGGGGAAVKAKAAVAKGTVAVPKTKRRAVVVSDDDEDEDEDEDGVEGGDGVGIGADIDALADEVLTDDEDEDEDVRVGGRAGGGGVGGGRPARRAAASGKKVWVIEDDDDEEEEEEDGEEESDAFGEGVESD